MKTAKKLKTIVIVVVLLIVVLVGAFHLFGAKAIEVGVEVGATKALKVPVAVGGVNLSILAGKAGVNDLVVDNPSGYQNEKLLEMGTAHVDLDLGSALSETVIIEDILLENVTVVLEQKGLTNNIQQVLDDMSSPASEKETPSKKPRKKLLIKNLQINEVAVKVKLLPIPGKQDTLTMKLSPITMTDLGSQDKLDIPALATKILLAIVNGIAEQGAGVLPDSIIGPMGDTAKELTKAAEAMLRQGAKVLDETKKQAEGMLKETQKAGEELKKGLGDIINGKKEDQQ